MLACKSSITGSQDEDVTREGRVAVAGLGAATATRLSRFLKSRLLHHTAHAAHAAHTSSAFLLWRIGDECIGGEEHTGYTTSILQGRACHLHRINDTCFEHIHVLALEHIKAVPTAPCAYIADRNPSIAPTILSNLAQRLLKRASQDVHARLLVARCTLYLIQCRGCMNQHRATTCYDAFLNSGTCSGKSILYAMLLLFEFYFGCSAHFNHAHATGQLGQSLLQLLAIIVARGLFNQGTHLSHARLNSLFTTSTLHDCCGVLIG